ncbi:MAG: hypothetical protein EU530_07375 [Promethearchaeota archaeon]|nr:MAG: hypothetical protein EU530_07375 [Candidatus Lokiarchaeota archaeon]
MNELDVFILCDDETKVYAYSFHSILGQAGYKSEVHVPNLSYGNQEDEYAPKCITAFLTDSLYVWAKNFRFFEKNKDIPTIVIINENFSLPNGIRELPKSHQYRLLRNNSSLGMQTVMRHVTEIVWLHHLPKTLQNHYKHEKYRREKFLLDLSDRLKELNIQHEVGIISQEVSKNSFVLSNWTKTYQQLINSKLTGNPLNTIKTAEELLKNPELPEYLVGMVHFYRGEGLRESGQHEKAIIEYNKAIKLIDEESNPQDYHQVLYQLGDMSYVCGDHIFAREQQNDILECINSSNPYTGVIYRGLGHLDLMDKQYKSAQSHYKNALEIAKSNRNQFRVIEAFNSIAEVNVYIDPNNVLPYISNARKLAEHCGAKLELGKGYYIEAHYFNSKRNYNQALQSAQKSNQILEKVQYASGLARVNSIIADTYIHTGQIDRAKQSAIFAYNYYKKENIYPTLKNQSEIQIERITDLL